MSIDLGIILSQFSILAVSGVSNNDSGTSITGDVGTSIGKYSGLTSSQIDGVFHPVNDNDTKIAQLELNNAFFQGSALPITVAGAWASGAGPFSGVGGFDITGVQLGTGITTLGPGVYNANDTLDFPSGNLTLNAGGDPNAIFIIKSDGLNISSGTSIMLANGANSCNIFFVVDGAVDLGSSADVIGNILSTESITLSGNNIVIGRLLTTGGAITLLNGASLITNICICYAKGTKILTPHGYISVENLSAGDEIFTFGDIPDEYKPTKRSHPKLQKIVWAGYFTATNLNAKTHPICIRRNALGMGVPRNDVFVSPNHGIFINDKFVSAKNLINGSTIYQDTSRKSVEYYHIETEKHSIIMADGLCAESFLDANKLIHKDSFVESTTPIVEESRLRPVH
jgi:hypothetical protein